MIEQVEEVGAIFELEALADGERLADGGVERDQTGSVERIARLRAHATRRSTPARDGVGGLARAARARDLAEERWIEERIRIAAVDGQRSVGQQIGTIQQLIESAEFGRRVRIYRERSAGRKVGDAGDGPAAQQLLADSVHVAAVPAALAHRNIQHERVDEAVPLIVATVAAFGGEVAVIGRSAQIRGRTEKGRGVIDGMAPGIGTVHRQDFVPAHFAGNHQSVEGRVADHASDESVVPLREREGLHVGGCVAVQRGVIDGYKGLVRVHVDPQFVSGRAEVADVDRRGVADLPLDSEVPVVGIGGARVQIVGVKADQSAQGNALVEGQVIAITRGRLGGAGALIGGDEERRVESEVPGDVIEDFVEADAESAADHGLAVAQPALAELGRVGEAEQRTKVIVIRVGPAVVERHRAGRKGKGSRAGFVGVQIQDLVAAKQNRSQAGNEADAAIALLPHHAGQFVAQADVEGEVGLHLDIVLQVQGVRVTIPVRERSAGGDGGGEQQRLTVATGAGAGEMFEIGEADGPARLAVQEANGFLTARSVAELERVAGPAEGSDLGRVEEQLVGVGDAALRQVGRAADGGITARDGDAGESAVEHVHGGIHDSRNSGKDGSRIEAEVLGFEIGLVAREAGARLEEEGG